MSKHTNSKANRLPVRDLLFVLLAALWHISCKLKACSIQPTHGQQLDKEKVRARDVGRIIGC